VIQHVALEIRREDAGACERFWSLLGFARVEPPAALAERAAWVECRGTQIHLLYTDDPVAVPKGHVAVVAEDYNAALERLRGEGFDPEPRTEHWGSPRSYVRDPAGHLVELMERPPG